jgi:MoaA/NifB/PqqE/SkfB family radical SAM enzyme
MAYLSFKKSLKAVKAMVPALIKSRVYGTPLWLHFYLTRRCNLSCRYCYVKDNTKKELSTEEVNKAIDKLDELGIGAIAFFGGEPTLRKDLCDILTYANKRGFFTYFTTNGTLLKPDYVKRIGDTGIDFIELSLDSISAFDESRKDFTRGKGALELLIEARKEYGFGLKTHAVITRKNLDSIIETIRVVDDLKIPLTVGLVNRNMYNDAPEDQTLYFNDDESKEKLKETVDKIIELKQQGVRLMDPVGYLEGIKEYVDGKTDWVCQAGRYFFSVDSDGSVQLCTGLKPYSVNILDIDKDFFRKRQQEINETMKWCKTKCYSNCSFTTSYFMHHPIKALLGR